jgi:8-oxo-dGTP pyrophosphatase MutT (NUDIX family)
MVDAATQASAEVPTPSVRFLDNLVNFVSSLGTARDPTTNAHYSFQELDRNTLEQAYRSDWIAQAVIDAPADDATREWRAWKASKNQIQSIEDFEKEIELRKKVKQWIVRARLYGGAALVIGVDDGKESWEELDLDAVEKGSLQFVVVLNRYELAAGPRIYNVSSRWYTRPEFYTVSTPLFGFYGEEGDFAPGASFAPQAVTPEYIRAQGQSSAGGGQNANVVRLSRGPAGGFGGDPYRRVAPYGGMVRLHPSRVMELAGHELPDWRLAPMGGGWGDSVLQVVDEALRDWGTLTGSIAAMTNDAKVDIVKLKDFTQRIGKQEYKTALLNRWMASNITKSTINALLLDQEEEWQRVQTSFGGLAELMREFMVTISGASKIPISRLFGQSAGRGLGAGSSGGEQDLKNYYDGVSSWQRNTVTPAMDYLDKVMVRSVLGSANKQIWYDWAPLYTMSDQEKATVAHLKAQTWQIDVQTGLVNENVLRQARISQLLEDGTYPGLEDAIDEFGEEPDIPEARVWSPAMGIDPNTGLPVGGGGGGGSPPPPGGAPPPAPGGPPKGMPPGGVTGGGAVAKPSGGPQSAVAKPAASGKGKTADADPFRDDFDETKHPRDPHGKFAAGGGGGDIAGKGKTHIVKQLLLQPGGTTLKEIKAKTGWTNVTVPGHAKIHGLDLTKSKNAAGETVYKGSPSQSPDTAAAKQAAEPKPSVTAATHVAEIAAAPKAETPALPGHQIQGFENADKWTKVGGKLGSNEGGTYKDASGQHWYVKTPPTADHAKNEVLTGKLYALAGAKVPETKLVGLGNKVSVASKIVPDAKELGQFSHAGPNVLAQKDFAADAWLGNRDSVGTGKNNMVVSGGDLYRIDHGGGMKYRAMGSTKAFTSDPTEFHTLRDPSINKDAADVFGKMTPQALKASIDKVGAVKNIDIFKTVESVYSGEEAKHIAETLIDRKAALQGEGFTIAKSLSAEAPKEKSTIVGTIAKAMGFGASEVKPSVTQAVHTAPVTQTFTKGSGEAAHNPPGTKGFSSWTPPATEAGWKAVSGQNPSLNEKPLDTLGQKAASGIVMFEPDGRVWLTKPTNAYGGYEQTFPKGKQDAGLSLQQNAIKETYEETGLKAKITGIVGDFKGDTSTARFYMGEREGGHPHDYGSEAEAVHLATTDDAFKLLNKQRDKDILAAAVAMRTPTTAAVESFAKMAKPIPPNIVGPSPAAQEVAQKFNAKWGNVAPSSPEQTQQKIDEYKATMFQVTSHAAAYQAAKTAPTAAVPAATVAAPKPAGLTSKEMTHAQNVGINTSDPKEVADYKALNRITNIASGQWDTRMKRGVKLGMTPMEGLAVAAYVGPHHQDINPVVRKNELSDDEYTFFKHAQNGLQKVQPFEGQVMRGTNLSADLAARYKVGKTVREDAFMSTGVGFHFHGNTLFTIQSKTGRDIRQINPGEHEVLFPANTYFRVTKNEMSGSTRHIHMEEP